MELHQFHYYCYIVQLSLVSLLLSCSLVASTEFYNSSHLRQIKHGVELAGIQSALHPLHASYKLEDFFWTGSGDGTMLGGDEDGTNEEEYTSSPDYLTIYSTKTVFVTPTTAIYTTPSTTLCHSCDASIDSTESDDELMSADKEFWLLTILKTDGKDPDVMELRRNLANLYRKAFLRQQAQHLGIRVTRIKRHVKPISVHIHKIDRQPIGGDVGSQMEVIYHVAVDGQPVDAATAAEDMRLVTDSEVKEALGYPFVVKAEPYIKPTVAQELAEVRSTWLVVSVSLLVFIILMVIIISSLSIAFCVRQRKRSRMGVSEGRLNQSYKRDTTDGGQAKDHHPSSPTYINFRSQASNETLNSLRVNSAQSSSTLSSSGSIDISPLMGVGKTRKIMQRPKAALNKTVPMEVHPKEGHQLSHSTSSSTSTLSDAICNRDPGVISPTSYLSMPSVKAFPKGNNPEPLHKILQPLSVHHLDMLDDDVSLKRQGSLGAGEDPGVIGPIVWNLHRHRMQRAQSIEDDDLDDAVQSTNVSRMRKRFHELLDDTFSLFGSRRSSPHRQRSVGLLRPKTTEARRSSEVPKAAWMSAAPSPLVRPISAPNDRPFTAVPQINRDLILVDGVLEQNDPAIPLIEEIKKEISKYSTTHDEMN